MVHEPAKELEEIHTLVHDLFQNTAEKDAIKQISLRLRAVEGSIIAKYEEIPKEKKLEYNLGEMKELIEAGEEVTSKFLWLYRFPALMLTVIIASSCIPLTATLDHVLEEYPILSGFPPAISAAAGCIGIQNTAIIIRAIGVKLIKGSPLVIFIRYAVISFLLSIGAAILEMIVAWIVISIFDNTHSHPSWSFHLLYTDVPIVIFIAMIVTGTLAGIMGAGVPLLVTWIGTKINKSLDPAHWVGPIETVAQELSATVMTLWVADRIFQLSG